MKIQAIWEQLKGRWSNSAAVGDVSAFDNVESELQQKLPADFKWFLMKSNGGETLKPLPRLCLYPLHDLLPRRNDGQPPGTIEFGTNDSDGFAFDLAVNQDTAKYPVLKYPLGSIDRRDTERVASDFAEFLTAVASGREP